MKFLRKLFGGHHAQPPPLPEEPLPTPSPSQPIRLAVGPSPWAWRDRSHVMGSKKFRFRDLGEDGDLSGITQVINEEDQVILLLDFQCYARFLDDGRVLMWWEDGDKDSKIITFSAFRFSDLPSISDPVAEAKRMRAEKLKSTPIPSATIKSFNCFLDTGKHSIDSPTEWSAFEETLVLADHAPGSNSYDVMHRALFAFDWIDRQVTVLPQDWFNNGKYDFGYQWVARIARTASGSLIGEGIRLGTFELDDSGREVKQWFTQNPFHMIQ